MEEKAGGVRGRGRKLRFSTPPHAQYYRAFGEHYARAFSFLRGCLVRKFWAAKVGGSVVVLGKRGIHSQKLGRAHLCTGPKRFSWGSTGFREPILADFGNFCAVPLTRADVELSRGSSGKRWRAQQRREQRQPAGNKPHDSDGRGPARCRYMHHSSANPASLPRSPPCGTSAPATWANYLNGLCCRRFVVPWAIYH